MANPAHRNATFSIEEYSTHLTSRLWHNSAIPYVTVMSAGSPRNAQATEASAAAVIMRRGSSRGIGI
jgi:hypothetical protein